jgi:hypothetical protein
MGPSCDCLTPTHVTYRQGPDDLDQARKAVVWGMH